MASIPFVILLGVFSDRNSFCGLIVLFVVAVFTSSRVYNNSRWSLSLVSGQWAQWKLSKSCNLHLYYTASEQFLPSRFSDCLPLIKCNNFKGGIISVIKHTVVHGV